MAEIERNITKEINLKRIAQEILGYYPSYEGLHAKQRDGWTTYYFFFSNPIDENQLDFIISEHDATLTSKEALIQLYYKRERDGYDFFTSVRADLALSYISGDITQQDAAYIEDKLDITKSKVLSGDWLTAQYEISNNVVVEGALAQETFDLIKEHIDQYILDNY